MSEGSQQLQSSKYDFYSFYHSRHIMKYLTDAAVIIWFTVLEGGGISCWKLTYQQLDTFCQQARASKNLFSLIQMGLFIFNLLSRNLFILLKYLFIHLFYDSFGL